MRDLEREALSKFASAEIVRFHQARLARLEAISLREVLSKKNPYLFKAKNVVTAFELVSGILDAFLSSSEEKIFGDFLEELAIFVASQSCGGRKSSAQGIDLEFDRDGTRYLVSIKSGTNWGNSSQYRALRANFRQAIIVQRQAHHGMRVQPVLGMCYGRSQTRDVGDFVRLSGQSFWYFLSGDPNLYVDIIEPIGHQAKQHNEEFCNKKGALVNKFTEQFIRDFCTDYAIDWEKLVQFNSGNLTQGDRVLSDGGCPLL
jgi:hypothetical protein